MLVIHPDECIDCGVCEPECPADAIIPDTDDEAEKWLELNREYATKWPVIVEVKPASTDADDFLDTPNKFKTSFSPKAGGN